MSAPQAATTIVLKKRPQGLCTPEDFETQKNPLPSLREGQVLVEVLYISVDPTNRIWMSEMPAYMPPVALGDVMRAAALGRVLESTVETLRPGELVSGLLGWRDYGVFEARELVPLSAPQGVSPSTLLGPLGMTGLTAYFGMMEIGKPAAGETVVVSAAAGAVGSIAGQIAKAQGARVIGIAGTPEKCQWLKEVASFDETICYRAEKVPDYLDRLCPNGIDVYFENVGGETLEAVLDRLALGARIPLCGLISQYNATEAPRGPKNFEQILMKRALIKGFIIMDYAPRFAEGAAYLGGLLAKGQLHYEETIVEGLHALPLAVNMLFDGGNRGKLLVRVA